MTISPSCESQVVGWCARNLLFEAVPLNRNSRGVASGQALTFDAESVVCGAYLAMFLISGSLFPADICSSLTRKSCQESPACG